MCTGPLFPISSYSALFIPLKPSFLGKGHQSSIICIIFIKILQIFFIILSTSLKIGIQITLCRKCGCYLGVPWHNEVAVYCSDRHAFTNLWTWLARCDKGVWPAIDPQPAINSVQLTNDFSLKLFTIFTYLTLIKLSLDVDTWDYDTDTWVRDLTLPNLEVLERIHDNDYASSKIYCLFIWIPTLHFIW